ncbi:terminus macrodomain insulation protein YfbV [Oceanimonas marisflavi]|uniref:terminus macrodomain insulation protein YfbV n=1 Tax=Oceanimonas marisflavi TaxID=2059724 RepID=UPI000D313709|nr:terminus macrodomain insulation protein YfbV [Oceanimonas marisflavi]
MGPFTHTLHRGQEYLSIWPRERRLASLFPENRIMAATRFGVRTMPALITLSLLLQFQFGAPQYWPSVVASVLFLASLPMQGYYWLGRRADTRLPPSLREWYLQIHEKIAAAGGQVKEPVSRPRYFELGETLDQAFRQLDKSFIDGA